MNKDMIEKIKKGINIIPVIATLFLVPGLALAFSVEKTGLPFDSNNLVPGSTISGSFKITNSFDSNLLAQIESVNGSDPDSLGSVMTIEILENSVPLHSKSLAAFMTNGIHELTEVTANGGFREYTIRLTLNADAPQSYMGASLGFDLCVGLKGNNTAEDCGEIVVGPENPTSNGGGGGGGGGGQSSQLIIFNEQSVAGVPQDTSAIITWNTNKLATSQVIYGLSSGAPYTLNLNAPNFGYPLGTTETSLKVINHNVPLSGLTIGETYVYRVVSRASPATVSPEYRFTLGSGGTITPGPIALGSAPSAPSLSSGGTSAQESNGVLELDESDPETAQETEQFAAALFAGFPSLSCITWALLIFLVIWLLSKVFFRTEEGTGCKRRGFVVLMTLIASIILWLIPYACPILPLWIVLIIYVVWTKISDRKRAKTSKGV